MLRGVQFKAALAVVAIAAVCVAVAAATDARAATPAPAGTSAAAGAAVTLSQPTFDVGSVFEGGAQDWFLHYTFHWTVSAPAGVCRQTLLRNNYDNLGAPYVEIPVATSARSYSTVMSLQTYFRSGDRLRVALSDCQGVTVQSNEIAVAAAATDEAAARLTYVGPWSVSHCLCASDGTTHWTSRKNASFSLRTARPAGARGVDIGLVMSKGPNRGSAAVYVDGVRKATINSHATAALSSSFVYQIMLTGLASHTITVVNLATRGHARIDIDAILNGG